MSAHGIQPDYRDTPKHSKAPHYMVLGWYIKYNGYRLNQAMKQARRDRVKASFDRWLAVYEIMRGLQA